MVSGGVSGRDEKKQLESAWDARIDVEVLRVVAETARPGMYRTNGE